MHMFSRLLENTFFFSFYQIWTEFWQDLHQSANFSTIRKSTSPLNPLKLNSLLVERHDNNATEVGKNRIKSINWKMK